MKPDPGKNLRDYARYSGMAFQMLAIVLAGVFAGFKLDSWLNTRPVFTIILSVVSVILAMYYVTRDLLRR
jgi:F0F1-type ATP synthase assembly protein I